MDADDIAAPERLERQLEHMKQHPEVSVLGGAIKMFKSGTTLVKPVQYPTTAGAVHFGMFYNCILVHPTILFKSSIFAQDANLRYNDAYRYAEDYALWLHIIESGRLVMDNLGNPPTLRLRKHSENESQVHGERQKKAARLALKTVLDRLILRYEAGEAWEVTPETVRCILTGYEYHTIETAQQAFKITEIIEKHLLTLSIFDETNKECIKSEAMKQFGVLASIEMRLSPSASPASLYCWTRWLSKKPISGLNNLLSLAHVSSALNDAKSSSESHASNSKNDQQRVKVSVICFSKDRAFQMQEYMRTLETYVIRSSPAVDFDVHIIWRASTTKFRDSYIKLSNLFGGSCTPNTTYNWIEESNFSQHLSDTVKAASPYILWGVDDVLYYNPTDIRPFVDLMEQDRSILCSTLRLSPNVTYCHPSNGHSKLPSFNPKNTNIIFKADDSVAERIFDWENSSLATEESSSKENDPKKSESTRSFTQDILEFDRTTATEDWNYPFELCATLMRKSVVSDILLEIVKHNGIDGLSHPNKLEVTGSRLFSKAPANFEYSKLSKCLCVRNPVLSVITINRVQDVCENRIYEEVSLEELERHFDEKNSLNLEFYRSQTFDAVHIGDFVLKNTPSS